MSIFMVNKRKPVPMPYFKSLSHFCFPSDCEYNFSQLICSS